MTPQTGKDAGIAFAALADITKWLGFARATTYVDALETEGEAIFDRVRDNTAKENSGVTSV